jgi:thiamine-phosphate pyrophosphorylase
MRLHVLVDDAELARRAVDDGATVVQLRRKGASTDELIALGRAFRGLPATLVVNDDVEAALALGAGVHLGQGDPGRERAKDARLLLGLSATSLAEALEADRFGCDYIGAGPVWATPSKQDAAPPIGLDGLREIGAAVATPVVAIGGIDPSNAGDCIRAGAAGVAVIRATGQARQLREAIDAAL